MAAAALTPAQTELIKYDFLHDVQASITDISSSFTQDEIPIKLRCAICSRLAVNAFRLPCCDQAICETCKHKSDKTFFNLLTKKAILRFQRLAQYVSTRR